MTPGRRVSHIGGFLLFSCVVSAPALADTYQPVLVQRYAPRDSTRIVWSMGAGAGIPYGVLGGKLAVGGSRAMGEFGFGFVPLAWESALSAGAVLHLGSRWAPVRPKLTVTYSTAAAAIIILDNSFGSTSLDPLYKELFPGFGVYGGMDWRIGRSSTICLDLNVGWIFPNVGNHGVEERYWKAVEDLIGEGYSLQNEKLSLGTPKISAGITYSPWRSQKVLYAANAAPSVPLNLDTLLDSDGDGIPDSQDQQPNTPRGAEVDRFGVAIDDDGDGVPNGIDRDLFTKPGVMVDQYGVPIDLDHDGVGDSFDRCPDTPAEFAVDEQGCPKEVVTFEDKLIERGQFEEQRIYFETGESTLLPESFPRLDVIGLALSDLPELRFWVDGHCDDRGTDEFNQELSERRAQAVVDYLVEKFRGVSREQFTARGFGKTQPVAVGTDEASRALNRRVEFVVQNWEDVEQKVRQQVERKRYLRRGEEVGK